MGEGAARAEGHVVDGIEVGLAEDERAGERGGLGVKVDSIRRGRRLGRD